MAAKFEIHSLFRSARIERGMSKNFHLDAPATAERIRMACEDHLTSKVPDLPDKKSFKPWGIQV